MAEIGKMNRLTVLRQVDFGLYLDGGDSGEILLPRREIPKGADTAIGQQLEVFIYHDSEDRLVASGRRPRAQLGQFAALHVVDINRTGIFLDWGLSKDLFMPHSEEKRPLQVGDKVLVYVYQDVHSGRLLASAQLERFAATDASDSGYQVNQEVSIWPAERTPHGFMCLVDEQYLGLLHSHEIFRPIFIGRKISGFVRELRDDGRLSLSVQKQGQEVRDELAERIMDELRLGGGVLELSDKSPASAISAAFGVSKGNYKKAVGGLFKQGLIEIEPECIRLR